MDLGIADKVAVVTGGAAGIGKAIAKALYAEGAVVVLADLDSQALTRAAGDLDPSGRRVKTVVADVTRPDSVRAMVTAAVAAFGTIHILVNNVGLTLPDWLDQVAEKDLEATWAVNMRGYVLTAREAVPHMKRQGWGRLVFLSSGSGLKGSAGLSLYSASKAFAIGLSRALGQELGPHGVTSNCLCPSDVYPEAEDGPGSWRSERLVKLTLEKEGLRSLEEVKAKRIKATPVRRSCRLEDVADTAAWLCSERAGFINCQTLGVNGGGIPT